MEYIEYINQKIQEKINGLDDEQKAVIADADQKRAKLSNKYNLYNQLFRNIVAEFRKLDKQFSRIKNMTPTLSRLFHDDLFWQTDNDLIAWRLPKEFDSIINKINGLKGHIYTWEQTERPRLEKAIEWTDNEDDKKKLMAFEEKMDSFVDDVLKPLVEIHYPAYEKCKESIGEQFLRKNDVEQRVYYQVLKEELNSPEMKEFIRTHVIEKKIPTLDLSKHTDLTADEYIIQNERLDIFKDFISSYANDMKNMNSNRVDRGLVGKVERVVGTLKEEGAKEPVEDYDFGKFLNW